jgi:hypothetical protein
MKMLNVILALIAAGILLFAGFYLGVACGAFGTAELVMEEMPRYCCAHGEGAVLADNIRELLGYDRDWWKSAN